MTRLWFSKRVCSSAKRPSLGWGAWRLPVILWLAPVLAGLAQEPLREIGSWGFGPVGGAAVRDGYVYYVSGRMLAVMTEAGQPVGELTLPGYCFDVQILGDLAAVLIEDQGLQLVDIHDPFQPVPAGFQSLPGLACAAYQTDKDGPIGAFARSDTSDAQLPVPVLDVYDLTDPDDLTHLATALLPALPVQMAFLPFDYLLMALEDTGLQTWDCENPFAPEPRGTAPLPWPTLGLASNGQQAAYSASYSNGVHLVDLADPANPSFRGEYATGYTTGVGFNPHLNQLLTGHGDTEVRVHAAADPFLPAPLYTVPVPGYVTDLYGATDGTVWAGAEDAGLVQIPPGPGTVPITHWTPQEIRGLAASGTGQVYAVDSAAQLWVLEVSNALQPVRIYRTQLDTPGYSEPGLACPVIHDAAAQQLVTVAPGSRLFQVLDVGNPALPGVSGFYRLGHLGLDATLQRRGETSLAFVATSSIGVTCLDYTNPQNITRRSLQPTSGNANGVAADGNRLYVASGSGGLRIYDYANPDSPALLGTLSTGGNATRVCVGNGIAYVADRNAGLVVVDATDPASPQALGTYPQLAGKNVAKLELAGHFLYVAFNEEGAGILLVADPSSLRAVAFYLGPGTVSALAMASDFLFTGNSNCGISVVDPSLTPTGDVNADNRLTLVDLVLLLNATVGNLTPGVAPFLFPEMGDLDGNGAVDAIDYLILAAGIVENRALPFR